MVTLLLIVIATILGVVLMTTLQRAAQAPARVRVENINIRLRRRSRR